MPVPIPPAEVAIDAGLIRVLLHEQHPDLAALPLALAAEGWDNELWRLGPDLAVRIPRRELGGSLPAIEHRWLPVLAKRLPVPVPAPVRVGAPGAGFPWPWGVVPWYAGETAEGRPVGVTGARALGRALHALHVPAPGEAPFNPYRGLPLAAREDPLAVLRALHDGVLPRALARIWRRALAAEAPGLPVWIHGDVHPRNLLVAPDGGLAAILDWGDLGAGDPAVDLSVLWTVLDPADHGVFCGGYGPVEGPLLARARGWALAFGAIFAGLTGDPGAVAIGRRTLARLQG